MTNGSDLMAFSLDDKLFHSPVANLVYQYGWTREKDLEIKLLKLKRIFSTGKIMCRDTLEKTYPENYYPSQRNYNGKQCVSLAKHISQKNAEDEDERHIVFSDENAYEMYPWCEISLVLNQTLYEENTKYLNGTRIPLEVQVLGDIDLKYAEAISIPAVRGIQPFFEGKSCDIADCIESYLDSTKYYDMLNGLLELVKKENISVPIVDIETGLKYVDNQEYRQLIKNYQYQRHNS